MKNRALMVIITVLAAAVGILAFLNQSNLANKQQDAVNPVLLIKVDGENTGEIDLKRIRELGGETFVVTQRSSGKAPVDREFTGVPLKEVLAAVNPDFSRKGSQIAAQASDAYVTAYSMDAVLAEENIYLVYEQDGKPLGEKREGGSGPLLLVVRQDTYAQNWCKFLAEIDIRP
jgi:DMSO/TMAO reductase YedYZ molybdopterin-dependent catalytic subunit